MSTEVKKTNTVDSNDGALSKWGILALAVGANIGAGLITMLPVAIAETGHSVWVSFLIAIIVGSIIAIPCMMVCSAVVPPGGGYGMVAGTLGRTAGGIYSSLSMLNWLGSGIYAISLAQYINSLIPAANVKVTAFILMTAFFILNLVGIKGVSRVQTLMTGMLIVGIATFVIVGLPQTDFALLMPNTNPEFFANGGKGVWKAFLLLMFGVGPQYGIFYARLAKDPKKTQPWVTRNQVLITSVAYICMAFIAAGTLPLEQVAGKPLTYVAQAIMPTWLFVFFMIAVPMMALSTTIISTYVVCSEPIVAAVTDGWYWKGLARQTKGGGYAILMGLQYLLCVVPLILDWDMNMLGNTCLLTFAILDIVLYVALWVVPKKYPEAWQNRGWGRKLPDWVFYAAMIESFALKLLTVATSASSVKPYIIVITVAALAISIPYAIIKVRKGGIKERSIDQD